MKRIIAVTSNAYAPLQKWKTLFEAESDDVEVVDLTDETLPPDDVSYALCFRPPAGRLASFRNLRLIISLGAGVDHITSDLDWPRAVPMIRMATNHTRDQMADYVAWACLSLLRDLPRLVRSHAARRWDPFAATRTVRDCRVGVLGLGAMGGAAARRLAALGFPVSGWSRSPRQIQGVVNRLGADGLHAIARESDILVCALPASAEVAGIIDRDLIDLLPEDAAIINVGRSEHVVLPDLIAALNSERLKGAILDVVPGEPLSPSDPLWDHPRLFLTPHLASIVSMEAAVRHAVHAIAALKRGDPLPHLFDPARGY